MYSVAVVDYGIVNLKSVVRALAYVGASIDSTSDYKRVLAADRVILPGVGAFPSGMSELTASGMDFAWFLIAFERFSLFVVDVTLTSRQFTFQPSKHFNRPDTFQPSNTETFQPSRQFSETSSRQEFSEIIIYYYRCC